MQENLDQQENFQRDTTVAQNLKAPERSQESKTVENNTTHWPFFPLCWILNQGNFSRAISDAQKKKIQAWNKINSLGLVLQISTRTKMKQYFEKLDSEPRDNCAWLEAPVEAGSPGHLFTQAQRFRALGIAYCGCITRLPGMRVIPLHSTCWKSQATVSYTEYVIWENATNSKLSAQERLSQTLFCALLQKWKQRNDWYSIGDLNFTDRREKAPQ